MATPPPLDPGPPGLRRRATRALFRPRRYPARAEDAASPRRHPGARTVRGQRDGARLRRGLPEGRSEGHPPRASARGAHPAEGCRRLRCRLRRASALRRAPPARTDPWRARNPARHRAVHRRDQPPLPPVPRLSRCASRRPCRHVARRPGCGWRLAAPHRRHRRRRPRHLARRVRRLAPLGPWSLEDPHRARRDHLAQAHSRRRQVRRAVRDHARPRARDEGGCRRPRRRTWAAPPRARLPHALPARRRQGPRTGTQGPARLATRRPGACPARRASGPRHGPRHRTVGPRLPRRRRRPRLPVRHAVPRPP